MENKDLMANALALKVLTLLADAGTAGLTRTQLLQAARCRSDALTEALKIEEGAFRIVSRQLRRSEFGLGRQPRQYWHKDFVPQEPLTVPVPDDIPVRDPEPGAAPPSSGTCRQCGGALPPRGPGGVPKYCSLACRNVAQEGGVTLGRFFDRATDPRTFTQLAILFVMADLTVRGFRIAKDVLEPNSRIIVHDGVNPIILTVIPISASGYFPPDTEYECMAAVYRDGRIRYGGRNALVFDTSADRIDPAPAPSYNPAPQKELAPEPEKPEDT